MLSFALKPALISGNLGCMCASTENWGLGLLGFLVGLFFPKLIRAGECDFSQLGQFSELSDHTAAQAL